MHHVEVLTTFDRPELDPYRTMRRSIEQREHGTFVAEGEKVVRRLLESDLTILSVLCPPKWARDLEPLLCARSEDIHVFTAEKDLLEALTGFSMYQGVLAVAKVPPPVPVVQILRMSPRPLLLVAVDGLSSAENLGALVRNAVAFGAHALLVGPTCASPYLRRAVRSSMGTIFKMPALELPDLAAALRELRARGMRCVAAHPHTDQRTLSHAHLAGDCCLVFGSEGQGLSPAVLAACDEAVAVPMRFGVDSLNVGSAAAVFLYEAARQRGQA